MIFSFIVNKSSSNLITDKLIIGRPSESKLQPLALSLEFTFSATSRLGSKTII